MARSGAAGWFVLPLLSPTKCWIRVEDRSYQAQEVHEVDLPVAVRLDYYFGWRHLSDAWEAGQYRSAFQQRGDSDFVGGQSAVAGREIVIRPDPD